LAKGGRAGIGIRVAVEAVLVGAIFRNTLVDGIVVIDVKLEGVGRITGVRETDGDVVLRPLADGYAIIDRITRAAAIVGIHVQLHERFALRPRRRCHVL
jgi:hypothetical protein